MALELIGLSTGHSGTGYLAQLLTAAGFPCGHERTFRAGCVWPPGDRRGEVSFASVAYLDHPVAEGARLVHLVRHPLDVITSWLRAGTNPRNDIWCRQLCDWPRGRSSPESLAWRWVAWNKLIARRAPEATLIKVEDRTGILDTLGFVAPPNLVDNPTYNTKRHRWVGEPRLTWDALGAAKRDTIMLADSYGY